VQYLTSLGTRLGFHALLGSKNALRLLSGCVRRREGLKTALSSVSVPEVRISALGFDFYRHECAVLRMGNDDPGGEYGVRRDFDSGLTCGSESLIWEVLPCLA
jgi:hypothetical protein